MKSALPKSKVYTSPPFYIFYCFWPHIIQIWYRSKLFLRSKWNRELTVFLLLHTDESMMYRPYAYDIIMSWCPPLGVYRITCKRSCQKCASHWSQARTKQWIVPQHGGVMTSMHKFYKCVYICFHFMESLLAFMNVYLNSNDLKTYNCH